MVFNALSELPVDNARVLVRADFDVSVDGQKICNDFRIRALIPTLEYLLSHQAKITILGHLGRPQGYEAALSLRPIAQHLERLMKKPIRFQDPWRDKGKQEKEGLSGDTCLTVYENLRFQRGEEACEHSFSKDLAADNDYFINDAFAVCHRAHASIVGLPKLLPSAAGVRLAKEIEVLTQVTENPQRPLAVVIGGVKIASKLQVVERFLNIADFVLMGGGLANILLSLKGFSVGNISFDKDLMHQAAKLNITQKNISLPVDVVTSLDASQTKIASIRSIGKVAPDEYISDIGPETQRSFSGILLRAKTIIWNGAMGYMPTPHFRKGTHAIAEAVAQSDAYTVVGGGSVHEALTDFGFAQNISHISTGGGAMLEFLAGESLPGIEALEASRKTFSHGSIQ